MSLAHHYIFLWVFLKSQNGSFVILCELTLQGGTPTYTANRENPPGALDIKYFNSFSPATLKIISEITLFYVLTSKLGLPRKIIVCDRKKLYTTNANKRSVVRSMGKLGRT